MKTFVKSQRGSALILCLPLIVALFLICVSLFSMTRTASRISNSGWQKTQSDALAEAGLQSLYAQMTNVPQGSTAVNAAAITSTTLNGKIGTNAALNDGTYSAQVLSSSNTTVNGQLTYTYVIQGTGVAADGKPSSKVRSTFTMTQNGMGGYNMGDQALKTAGNVNISGGATSQDPTGGHGANIFANGSITDSSSGVSIDGTASAYAASTLTGKAYSVVPLTTPMSFPSAATTTAWRTTWLTQAQESTPSHPGGYTVSGNLTYSANATLTAPAYITGSLTVSGGHTLTINVDPAASTPCVVFVHGSVTVSGGSSLANNGVLLVSDGTQTYSGGSGVYSAKDMVNCGLISFSTNLTQAINISGGSGVAKVGPIYAINGGATLSGGSVFQGSLTAGGVGSTVTLSGGSSVRYESGWDALFAPFAPGYTSSGLGYWVRTL